MPQQRPSAFTVAHMAHCSVRAQAIPFDYHVEVEYFTRFRAKLVKGVHIGLEIMVLIIVDASKVVASAIRRGKPFLRCWLGGCSPPRPD